MLFFNTINSQMDCVAPFLTLTFLFKILNLNLNLLTPPFSPSTSPNNILTSHSPPFSTFASLIELLRLCQLAWPASTLAIDPSSLIADCSLIHLFTTAWHIHSTVVHKETCLDTIHLWLHPTEPSPLICSYCLTNLLSLLLPYLSPHHWKDCQSFHACHSGCPILWSDELLLMLEMPASKSDRLPFWMPDHLLCDCYNMLLNHDQLSPQLFIFFLPLEFESIIIHTANCLLWMLL